MTQPNSPFPGTPNLASEFVKKATVEEGWKDTEPRQANTCFYSTWVPGAQMELGPKVN